MIAKVIGLCAATLTMFSFVPQIIKMVRCRSARDVSLATIIQLASGVFLWIIYGILQKDLIIILANTVTFGTLFTALYLYFKFRTPRCDQPK